VKPANDIKEYFIEVNHEQEIYKIPVLDICGTPSDKILFIVSALHGDEYEACRAIQLLNIRLRGELISGRVIAFPVANPAAFKANSRTTPELLDGMNLARSFPGSPDGSLTEKIADKIWQFILQNKSTNSFLLDLHSGGQHYSYVHLSGVRDIQLDSPISKISMDLARAMQIPNLWIMPATEGTISTVAIAAGIPAIGCEMEGTGGLNDKDVEVYLKGILNVLKYTQQLQSGEYSLQAGDFLPIETILSPGDGFIPVFPSLKTKLKSGDEICEILDSFGNFVTKIFSPCTGEIWAVRRNPSISKNEIVALVSNERNQHV
jgi:predicted deacylase